MFCHSTGLLSPKDGQLVLAGDPKQLGPILRSPLALEHGLGESADYLYLNASANRAFPLAPA